MRNLSPGSTLDSKKGTISDYDDIVSKKILLSPAIDSLKTIVLSVVPINSSIITTISMGMIP